MQCNSSSTGLPIGYSVIGASLSKPHTSEMRGVSDHAQKPTTKIGLFMCATRIQRQRL